MKRFLAAVGLLTLAAPTWGNDFTKGFEAYARGDYATALREWRPLAEKGDAFAQEKLGLMYDQGDGVPQDYAQAVKWYQRAADQGLVASQATLGFRYRDGRGSYRRFLVTA